MLDEKPRDSNEVLCDGTVVTSVWTLEGLEINQVRLLETLYLLQIGSGKAQASYASDQNLLVTSGINLKETSNGHAIPSLAPNSMIEHPIVHAVVPG